MTDRAAEIAALYITDPADRDALAESIRIEMRAARQGALGWAADRCRAQGVVLASGYQNGCNHCAEAIMAERDKG